MFKSKIGMNELWLRWRWYDFRQGHSLYLIFALSFGNFILIFHRLLIERVPILNEIFSNLWIFAVFFILAYIPVAVIIGNWHKKTQLKIDIDTGMRQNLLLAKSLRVIIDISDGKASKEEKEGIRKLLKAIEEGKGLSKMDK